MDSFVQILKAVDLSLTVALILVSANFDNEKYDHYIHVLAEKLVPSEPKPKPKWYRYWALS